MNKLLENALKDRFHISQAKIEHLRSSRYYEDALNLAEAGEWDDLRHLLMRIQIITNRVDMRHTKGQGRS